MDYINLIKNLDNQTSSNRLEIIIKWLTDHFVNFTIHTYASGKNLIVDIGDGPWIGVSSHFDRVDTTAGANDNSSAIVACLGLVLRLLQDNQRMIGVRVFFFDEEENGLRGSSAYVNDYGINDLIGVINLEMVGRGDMIAIWPVDNMAHSPILDKFERIASHQRITALRFDRIVTNTADHVPFSRAGLNDTFSLTCVSKEDLAVADKYFKAISKGTSPADLFKILNTAPLFQHYHQPTDTYEKIEEKSLIMIVDVLERTINGVKKLK